ncbi:MAG: alpha/beta fold hydrolase [Candidatus Rokuibacteriota bacterium]
MEARAYRQRTRDGVELSILRYAGEPRYGTPVLLTHGTFSNATVCTRLAAYLCDAGFDCWILELRGHGRSAAGNALPDFEWFSEYDLPAALDTVRRITGKPGVLALGHSGGGLIFLMHLARYPTARAQVTGLVTLAAQATAAGASWSGRTKISLFALGTRVLGYTPGPLFGFGPQNEFAPVIGQWCGWNRRGRWIGRDGFDYLTALGELTAPALCLAGSGDRFIAPVAGCRALFDALGTADKAFVECGTAHGFAEDYTHARLIASRPAREEIWPLVRDWLVRHATRTAEAAGAAVTRTL